MEHMEFQRFFSCRASIAVVLAATLGMGVAHAQIGPQASPSPAAPGDLRKPIFDTRTPSYGPADYERKAASTVVADVDGRAITLGDVKDMIARLPPTVAALPFTDLFPGVLDKLVRQEALVILAQRQALDEDPEIRRKVKAADDQVLTNEVLQHEVSKNITEQMLLDRYAKDYANKPGPEEVHARGIMVASEEEAMDIIDQLRKGADFAELAKKFSKDTTAPIGGDFGWQRIDGLNAEVGSVVFALAPGQTTAYPIHSVGGFFVLRVEDRRKDPTPTFPEVRSRIMQTLLREGVNDVVAKAMAQVTVREFSITGKEVDLKTGQ